MKYALTIALLFLTANINAQSVTISNQLEQGFVHEIKHISYNQDKFSLHYFHSRNPILGVSYKPIQVKGIKAGMIISNKGLPTVRDAKVNFILDIGFTINNVRISWNHISNGFGIWHRPNHGFDSISFTVKI